MPSRTEHRDTTFADAAEIIRTDSDDWYDLTLHRDTGLFVDPFLMFDENDGLFADAQAKLVRFFNEALMLVAEGRGRPNSQARQKASQMLSFPEPSEFGFGFTKTSVHGRGTGRDMGLAMLDAADRSIDAGIRNVEELGDLVLFGEGFGVDRISDMVCNILKADFITYTKQVLSRHDVATTAVNVEHAAFDYTHLRWRTEKHDLFVNPCFRPDEATLLVPERFLAEIPSLDDSAFWDWVYDNFNQQLRQDLGWEVTRGLRKREIIERATRLQTLRLRYGRTYEAAKREQPPKPYSMEHDPKFVGEFQAAQDVLHHLMVTPPTTADELCGFVDELVDGFKDLAESTVLRPHFWNDGAPRREPAIQGLFHTAVKLICEDRDIDISPEVDTGIGRVDFKFSRGHTRRALVELKFADTSSFWDTVEEQTPAYLKSTKAACGTFLVIQHHDRHCTPEFEARVRTIVDRVNGDLPFNYKVAFVDVRDRPTASKIKRTRTGDDDANDDPA